MVALVLVSHSATLAAGVAELVRQVAGPDLPLHLAAGAHGELGTDAVLVLQALQATGPDGAVVLMDLGSAVLSAETALDLLDPDLQPRIRLASAPFVEGALAAAVRAVHGGTLQEVHDEACAALAAKTLHLEPAQAQATDAEAEFPVLLPHGLHARPAALLVRAAAGAQVQVRNATTGSEWVDARSLSRVLGLDLLHGQKLGVRLQGPDPAATLQAILEALRTPPA